MDKKYFKKSILCFTPHFNNLYFFNTYKFEASKFIKHESDTLRNALGNTDTYEQFLKHKGRRPNVDIYACFQPFNEATKALFPFLKALQSELKPNDIILNLWDRSGWLTSLLCGLFPEQKIITTWEGDKDVLGYKGYHFWMQSYSNLEIVFHNPEKPLPFTSDSIACSIGLDLLHRFDQILLLNELNRVVNPSGCILFPHVHLSNNTPEPFFERGGHQLHGKTYQHIIDRLFSDKGKRGYIFSEPELFIENDIKRSTQITIQSTPNTIDYNGFVAILPESWTHKTLGAFSLNDIPKIEQAYILINELLDINLHQNTVSINRGKIEGQLGYLLDRHPIYLERIQALDGFKLSEQASKYIYLARNGFSIDDISRKTHQNISSILKELTHFEQLGLLQVLPLSQDGIRLQYYLMNQHYILTKEEQYFPTFWKNTVRKFGQHTALISLQDQSEFTYEDCDEIIQSVSERLSNTGLAKGDRLLICSKVHTESILLLWACLNLGIIVVPINADLPLSQIEHIIKETAPKYCFYGESAQEKISNIYQHIPHVIFDEDNNKLEYLYFSDWIDQIGIETNKNYSNLSHTGNDSLDYSFFWDKSSQVGIETNHLNLDHTDTAVILFTSGSTGQPKGVKLSHGHLIRSGRLITESFHWRSKDRFYSLGSLNTMSGLRNSSVSSLHVGGCVIIPHESDLANIITIAESIHQSKASILGSNPTFLRQLVNYKSKIKGLLNSVELVICTGNKLSQSLREEFKTLYKLPIHNYYGLTETTGICLAQHKHDNLDYAPVIGKPTDYIAQVVNESGEIVTLGETGELRVYGVNIMQGYLNNQPLTQEVIKDGWFYTNDLVRYTTLGDIELIGRKKIIIKTKSEELIYLSEIQNYIQALSFIEDSFIHPIQKGELEQFIAFIVLKPTTTLHDNILSDLKHLISENLGKHKVPNQFIIRPKLPYNFDGKISIQTLLSKLNDN